MSRYKSEVSISSPWYQSTPIPKKIVYFFRFFLLQETQKFSATIVGYFQQYVEWVKKAVSVCCFLSGVLSSVKSKRGLHTERARALGPTVHSSCVASVKMAHTQSQNNLHNSEEFLLRGVSGCRWSKNAGIHWSPRRSPRCSPQTHKQQRARSWQEAAGPAALRLFHRLYLCSLQLALEVAPCEPFSNMLDTVEIITCSFIVDSMVKKSCVNHRTDCFQNICVDFFFKQGFIFFPRVKSALCQRPCYRMEIQLNLMYCDLADWFWKRAVSSTAMQRQETTQTTITTSVPLLLLGVLFPDVHIIEKAEIKISARSFCLCETERTDSYRSSWTIFSSGLTEDAAPWRVWCGY